MPKYLARLAQAEYHPGTAVLRDIVSGKTYLQLPLTQARALMGGRHEVHYIVSIRQGAYHLDQEVPIEEVSSVQAQLYPRDNATPC